MKFLVINESPNSTPVVPILRRGFPEAEIHEICSWSEISAIESWDSFSSIIITEPIRWMPVLDILDALVLRAHHAFMIMVSNSGDFEIAVGGMKKGLKDVILGSKIEILCDLIVDLQQSRTNNREIQVGELVKKAVGSNSVGLWLLDTNGDVIFVNQEGLRIWGKIKQKGFSRYNDYKGWWRDSGRQLTAEEWPGYRAVRYGEVTLSQQIEIESEDGFRRILLHSSFPTTDRIGKINGAVVLQEDISEYIKLERDYVENQQKLNMIMEHMGDIIVQTNKFGQILWASPSLKRVLGYEPEMMTGLRAMDYIHPDDLQASVAAYAKAYAELSSARLQHRFKHSQGHYIWLETLCSLILDTDGSIQYGIINIRDINDRKQAEESFYDASEKLRVLIEASPMAIMAANQNGELILWNPAAEEMFGVAASDILGKSYTLYNSDASSSIKAKIQSAFQGKVIDEIEYPFIDPKGNQRYVAMSIAPLLNANGGIVGVMGIGLDVTDRKTAERMLKKANEELEERVGERTAELVKANIALQEGIKQRERITIALRESEQLYKSLIDLSPDSVILADADGRIVLCSKKVASLNGYDSVDELVGELADILVSADEREQLYDTISKARDIGFLTNIEATFLKKNGEKYPAEINVSIIRDEADQVKYYLVVARDISERKQFEAAVLQRNVQLEALRQIGLELTAELESDVLVNSIVFHAMELVGGAFAVIYIYKPDLDLLVSQASFGRPPFIKPEVVYIKRGEGIAGRVLDTLQPIVVDDYDRWEGRSPQFEKMGFQAIMGMPILWKEELLGVIVVSKEPPNIFSNQEIDLLRLWGMQAAIALRNINAMAEEKKQRQRADALARIAARANVRLDLMSVLSSVCEETSDAFHSSIVTISLLDEQTNELVHVYSYGLTEEILTRLHPMKLDWYKEKLIVNDRPVAISISGYELGAGNAPLTHENFSLAMAGLFNENRLIGTLNLISLEKPVRYSRDDLDFLQSLASQAAISIANARLLEETLQRTKELETISLISASLRRASGVELILPLLAAKTRELFLADFCLIAAEHDNDIVVVGDAASDVWRFRNRSLRDIESPWKTSVKEDVLIYFGAETPIWLNWLHEINIPIPSTKVSAVVLLRSYDTIIGLAIISFFNLHKFSENEINLLLALADLAGNALQRAGALETLEKHYAVRTRDLRALYEITWILNERLELADSLEKVLEKMMTIFQGESAAIHLFDRTSTKLTLAASLDVSDEWKQSASEINPEGRFGEWINAHTEPLLLSGDAVRSMVPNSLLQDIYEVYLGVPILSKGRPMGVMSIFGGTLEKLGIDELVLFSSVADQIGLAVERSEYQFQAAQILLLEERQKLARDLHDSVAQLLYSMNIMTEGYRRSVKTSTSDEIESWLDELGKVALRSLKEMRLLLYELRPFSLDENGLVGALRRRLDAVEGRSGIKGQLIVDGDIMLKPWIQEELFFIAQEALNNSLKHGSATQVWVRLTGKNNLFEMEVEDNGTGFDILSTDTRSGIGLSSMRERINKLGGEFELFSMPGSGTRVKLSLEVQGE